MQNTLPWIHMARAVTVLLIKVLSMYGVYFEILMRWNLNFLLQMLYPLRRGEESGVIGRESKHSKY